MTQTSLQKLAFARMGRVDPPPYDRRTGEEYAIIRVLIDSATINQAIPNGNLVCNEQAPGDDGKIARNAPYTIPQVYEIYANQLDAVEALVETASDAELAAVARDLEYHTAECEGTLPGNDKPKNSRPYWPSYASSFRAIMHRDPMPFRSVEVLKPKTTKRAANG